MLHKLKLAKIKKSVLVASCLFGGIAIPKVFASENSRSPLTEDVKTTVFKPEILMSDKDLTFFGGPLMRFTFGRPSEPIPVLGMKAGLLFDHRYTVSFYQHGQSKGIGQNDDSSYVASGFSLGYHLSPELMVHPFFSLSSSWGYANKLVLKAPYNVSNQIHKVSKKVPLSFYEPEFSIVMNIREDVRFIWSLSYRKVFLKDIGKYNVDGIETPTTSLHFVYGLI